MNNKKILLTSMSIVATATPLIVVVSCSGRKDGGLKSVSDSNTTGSNNGPAAPDKDVTELEKKIDEATLPEIKMAQFNETEFTEGIKETRKKAVLAQFDEIKKALASLPYAPSVDKKYNSLTTMVDKDKLSINDACDNMYLRLSKSARKVGIESTLTSIVNGDTLDVTIDLSASGRADLKKQIKVSIDGWGAATDSQSLQDALKATGDKIPKYLGGTDDDGSLLHHDANLSSWGTPWVSMSNKGGISSEFATKYQVSTTDLSSVNGIAFGVKNIDRLDPSDPDYETSVNANIILNPLTKSVENYINKNNIAMKSVPYKLNNLVKKDDMVSKIVNDATYKIGDVMTVADLPDDGQPWMNGIGWFAYQETTSYILNLAQKLGWKPEEDQHYQNTDSSGELYVDNATLIKNLDDFISQVPSLESAKTTEVVGESAIRPAKTVPQAHDTYLDPVSSDGTTGVIIPNTLGFDFKSTLGENHSNGRFGEGDNQVVFNLGATYHDGDNPGSLIMKLWSKKGSAKGVYTAHTSNDYGKTYGIKSSSEIADFYKFVLGSIIKIKDNYSDWGSNLPTGETTVDFRKALKFIVDYDIDNNKLWEAVKDLNNGSHYLPAIEVFMRGFHFDDKSLSPAGARTNLTGLLKLKSAYDMTYWMHNQNAYTKPSNNATTSSDEMYDIAI